MLRKILLVARVLILCIILCFFVLLIISVNQAKNIVRYIDEQKYDDLEDACKSAIFIDKIPKYSLVFNAIGEVSVWTPLQEACISNDAKAVTILLENGADPDKTPPFQLPWFAPIQIAASNGNVDVLNVLIQHGADVKLYGHNALVKLTKSARYGEDQISLESYKNCYTLLEKHGMDASHPSFEKRSLLCEAALLSDIEVTKYLVSEKGISATVCDSDGRTLLHHACLSGFATPNAEYIRYLLDCGVDPKIKDSKGKTAYDYAVEAECLEIANMLS